jgi:3-methyl-2-oxobutanoate hydroxymethyltransferase
MVTAYDAPSARIAEEAGADIILVGDSAANVVLGFEDTLSVTVDDMVNLTAAVSRTSPASLVVGDMPWMSYHVSPEDSVRNAARLVREGGAGAVKLEGGRKRLTMVKAIRDAEIPVMGHLGLTPQSVHAMGGYRVQGKEVEAARALVADAEALDDAGVFALVLEGVPEVVAQLITNQVSAPTIGIGAGPHCDGQVLVFHDVLGLKVGKDAKFVRRYGDMHNQAVQSLRRFFDDVKSGDFPGDDETYHMSTEAAAVLLEEDASSDDS